MGDLGCFNFNVAQINGACSLQPARCEDEEALKKVMRKV